MPADQNRPAGWGHTLLLVVVLVVGVGLRLRGLDWDAYTHHHPDERYISWVATTIAWPSDQSNFFDPTTNPLNPYHWPPEKHTTGIIVTLNEPRKFAYGHLPLYLGVAATRLAEHLGQLSGPDFPPPTAKFTQDILNGALRIEYHHLTAVGRALTAVVDSLTLVYVYLLGRRLFDRWTGLLAAALLAVAVIHVQSAHFFIVDPYLALFCTAGLYYMVRATDQPKALWAAGICIGLALGSKVIGGLLVFPLVAAIVQGPESKTRRLMWLVGTLLLAGLVFALTNPFALLANNCATPPNAALPTFGSCWLANLFEQQRMAAGALAFPFTYQYQDTTPYLYHLNTLLRWGLGPALGLAALAGWGWAVWRAIRQRRKMPAAAWVVLIWTLAYFGLVGGQATKFMRYLLPLTPLLAVYAAALLAEWLPRRARWPVIVLVLGLSAAYALAFSNMYSQPHPLNLADEWLAPRLTGSTRLTGERWDEPLRTGGRLVAELNWLTGPRLGGAHTDLVNNLKALAGSDYLAITSSRVYAVAANHPQQYPLAAQYYQLLFSGQLGFELVFTASRAPHLGSIVLWPPRPLPAGIQPISQLHFGPADESFLVYDQPYVLIFENRAKLTAEEMLALFEIVE